MRPGPGVEGECGTRGEIKGPQLPGGKATGILAGRPMPLNEEPILLEGTAGIDGNNVGWGPIIPTGGGNDVGPLPIGGIAPRREGTPGN